MIPLSKPNIGKEEKEKIIKVLESGWWTMGPVTEEFEEEFAKYKGFKHAIAVNSCSNALILAIKSVINGERFIKKPSFLVPTMTFCATVNALIFNNIWPVFVDSISVENPNMDIDKAGPFLKEVYGVIPVHFGGKKVDTKKIKEVCYLHNLWDVYDSAHAVEGPATKEELKSRACCYSFNPIKNLAGPESGMVCTNHDYIAEQVKSLRLHGMSCDSHNRVQKPGMYTINEHGYKMNCTDIESAVALCQLKKLDSNLERRRKIIEYYSKNIQTDFCFEGDHLFQLRIEDRDEFVSTMKDEGVCCGIHYRPVHLHPYYQKTFGTFEGMFPIAEKIGNTTVSLPLGPGMTDNEVEYVVTKTNKVLLNILKKNDFAQIN